MVYPEDEKSYAAFMINRGLSYFQDTILLANEMNINHSLDNRMQYDFLLKMVRKRKRFSKWFKADQPKDMSIIMDYYGYSRDKALQVLPLFNKEQIKSLERKMYTGGKKKRK